MHDQPSPTDAADTDTTEQAILTMLLDPDNHRPWSVDEVAREIGDRVATTDALAALHGAGLVHRCGEFVFPTRAAVRASEIAA